MQELAEVPLELNLTLYKHGPFSFELRDQLSSMVADGLLEVIPQTPPYGPKLAPTAQGLELAKRFPKTLEQHHRALDFIATKLGDRGVVELEELATALMVTREEHGKDAEGLAQEINKLKSHVNLDEARRAVGVVAEMIREFATGSPHYGLG